ncbi:MAG: GIY-YIG nuclease family protein, partial [Spirochaetaceae bacterium]|nr:GIY-YIG nuclease family protein [Spirochaetaceae bacterium]
MPEPKHGIVYVLTNPAMPGLVKIGKTTNEIQNRLNDLNTTGVPFPFDCLYACEVDDCGLVETSLHKKGHNPRHNGGNRQIRFHRRKGSLRELQ